MDYFSRWPEARSLTHTNAQQVTKFIYEKIICRFSISKILQSDRRIYFINKVIQELINKFKIIADVRQLFWPL